MICGSGFAKSSVKNSGRPSGSRACASLLVGPPLIQLIVFGYAVNLDVEHARMAWVDRDRTPESRELLAAFQGSGRFEVVATPADDAAARTLLDRGEVQLVVAVLPGFARDVERGRTADVQILVDGTNSNTASLVSSYAGQVVGGYSAQVMSRQMKTALAARASPANPGAPDLKLASRVWFNPDLKSRNYFVPGVMVNIIMLVTIMLTAHGHCAGKRDRHHGAA